MEIFSIGALKEIPLIADFTFGDEDGNFMMVSRNNAGAIDTKLVQNAPGARKVVWIRMRRQPMSTTSAMSRPRAHSTVSVPVRFGQHWLRHEGKR